MRSPVARLVFAAALMGLVWGLVLPRLARTRQVRQRERWLEKHQIDPAAMYYTELPVMEKILARQERGQP
jgi:hypothetical protein